VLYPRQEGFTYTTGSTSTPLSNFHISDLIIDGTHRTGTFKGYHGQFHVGCSWTTGSLRGASSVHLSGTIDVRIKVTAPDWTPATARMLVGQMGLSGTRSWALCLSTAGLPQIMYSADGAAISMMSNSSVTGLADGATKWVRALFTPNDGAGNRVLKCYLSDDGLTWTQLGTTVTTAGAVALFNAATEDPYSGFGLGGTAVGAYQPWIGQIHEVDIRDGQDGPPVAPRLPDLWSRIVTGTPTVSAPTVGAPVLTIVNGSHPGGNIAYLGDATRLPKMTPDYGQALVLTSSSHNVFALSAVGEDGIYLGYGGAATTLTSCMVVGNLYTGDSPTKVAVNIDPAVTLSKTRIINNLPDSASDTTTVAASYTAKLSDRTIVSDGGTTIYIPAPAVARAGAELTVKNINAANVTLAFTPSGPTIDGATTLVLAQWASADLVCTGTQWLKK
jgi:hypothetical protein